MSGASQAPHCSSAGAAALTTRTARPPRRPGRAWPAPSSCAPSPPPGPPARRGCGGAPPARRSAWAAGRPCKGCGGRVGAASSGRVKASAQRASALPWPGVQDAALLARRVMHSTPTRAWPERKHAAAGGAHLRMTAIEAARTSQLQASRSSCGTRKGAGGHVGCRRGWSPGAGAGFTASMASKQASMLPQQASMHPCMATHLHQHVVINSRLERSKHRAQGGGLRGAGSAGGHDQRAAPLRKLNARHKLNEPPQEHHTRTNPHVNLRQTHTCRCMPSSVRRSCTSQAAPDSACARRSVRGGPALSVTAPRRSTQNQ